MNKRSKKKSTAHVRNVNENLLTRFKETRYDTEKKLSIRNTMLEGSFQSASLS